MSLNPAILDNTTTNASPSSMAIAKRINPGALTVDKGTSHKNTARPIPAFLTKLFTMVNDPSTDHLIKWNEPNGDSFFVVSSERFGRELLPKYFKHSNFGSFVRQLNMYGFHKVPHLNQGVLQGEIPETEMLEFTNLNFQRGQPDLLCLIQRKKPCPELTNPPATDGVESISTAVPANSANSPNELQVILADIASIRKHQNLISSDLKTLQSSNAHLWKEAIANRDRNKRCQDTINKILGFLAQVFAGKLSSLQDPPPGNSGSNTPRTGVNRNQATTDDHPMGILMHEGASIPELERHRSRSKNSRDNQPPRPNDLGYPPTPSNSAVSLYSKMRHPRLMLEDTQRPPPPPKPPTNSSNVVRTHMASNSDTPMVNGVSTRNKNTSKDKSDRNTNGAPSPSVSARNSSAGSSPSPDLISSSQFCDSSIDPNLETASLDGTKKTVDNLTTTANNSSSMGATDQSNPDAVLQALFNDNFSNGGGYNLSDNLFSGINWAEVFNTSNELNRGFDENKTQQQPAFMTSPSPLRITDGAHNAAQAQNNPTSSFLSPINISNDPTNQLVIDAQGHANGIGNVANKVESLEAAIERLVGSLPDSMDYQLPMDLEKSHLQSESLFQPSTAHPRPDYDGSQNTNGEFDTDAFIRNLVSPGNEDQTNSVSGMGTCNVNPTGSEGIGMIATSPPLGSGGIGRSDITNGTTTNHAATLVKGQSTGQAPGDRPTRVTDQDPMDALDLDRILDEWTCEDAARLSPVAGINPGRLSSSLSNNYNFGEENELFSPMNSRSLNQRSTNSSGAGPKNPASSKLTLDLNDDDQLRRIMRKKPSTVPFGLGGGSDDLNAQSPINSFTGLNSSDTRSIGNSSSAILAADNNSKNSGTSMMAIGNKGDNAGGDRSASIISMISSNHQDSIMNDDHHQPSSMRKRFLEDANHQAFQNLLPHPFDDLTDSADLNDQSASLTLQQKRSRIY